MVSLKLLVSSHGFTSFTVVKCLLQPCSNVLCLDLLKNTVLSDVSANLQAWGAICSSEIYRGQQVPKGPGPQFSSTSCAERNCRFRPVHVTRSWKTWAFGKRVATNWMVQ